MPKEMSVDVNKLLDPLKNSDQTENCIQKIWVFFSWMPMESELYTILWKIWFVCRYFLNVRIFLEFSHTVSSVVVVVVDLFLYISFQYNIV